MIGRIYRLIDTKRIEMKQYEIPIDRSVVLVRPEYMSICAADQRYYLGQRKKEILNKKLPMALIHEATGIVIRDFANHFHPGMKVVLVPLKSGKNSEIKGNYRTDSKFASSDADGFMRDIVALSAERLIPIESSYSDIYVFSEILSVALGAINAFEAVRQTSCDSLAVWGDGSMGFATTLVLRCKYPNSKIYVFGKKLQKLTKFSFATNRYFIDDIPSDLSINHAFECVGGEKSEEALSQIMKLISPQGVINLFGVSENSVSLDTRTVLEKGLTVIGNSRSDREDFKQAVKLICDSEMCRQYLKLLISEIVEIKNEKYISKWFEQDIMNDFKTIGKWEI